LETELVVRGELLIPEKLFQKKYSKTYQNPRNMVSGLIGSKSLREGISDIRFIAYEIVGSGKMPSPENQFEKLSTLGFETAQQKIISILDIEVLSNVLLEFKNSSIYEIDGIVIQSNIPYNRYTNDNPKYAFAFKIQGESASTEVIKVEWNISKWGALKPTVLLKPIKLSGVTISKCTGNNAKFIMENKIGPGAIVTIIRSGDVIPKIIDIPNPSSSGQEPDIPHLWNETQVDFIAIMESENSEMCIQRITSFFDKLDIKHIGKARVKQLYDSGIDTIIKIIKSTEKELTDALDSEPMGTKIYKNIREKLTNIKTYNLLGSTGVFGEGIGQRKLKSLFEEIPNILDLALTLDKDDLKELIMKIKGYSDISADLIVNNINWAIKFMDSIDKHVTTTLNKTPIIKKYNNLDGEILVISGFRDTDGKLKSDIESHGGKLLDSWRANATGVIVDKKATGNPTGKVKQALQKGLPVYTLEEFKDKFLS
jgi:NAD-dependent DNA ligase